ncbi:hypothetical protein GOBAR_AA40022 [Gossypium barbadense]|uniref:Uncharacterized protein n=1 Tax=Gossypium barbadense TaxID=3634 RepID=A0A2P5VPF0_GOSBA|nr:hypothetical protein GOBAR_AA40022 [Gossypium barbadense]
MGSVAKKGLQKYLLQLQHHPLRTKAITAAVLSGISDTVSQKLSGIPKLQLRRILLKMGALQLGRSLSELKHLADTKQRSN